MNINTCKYFLNIYCMCVYYYIHNKSTQNTHIYIMQIKTFVLDVINRNYSFDSTNIYTHIYTHTQQSQSRKDKYILIFIINKKIYILCIVL